MLVDALIAMDLPRTVGPPLPTPFWEGLERWLFTGSWARRMATVSASTASVLARTHAALREALPDPAFEIWDDAGELVDLSVASAGWGDDPAPWAEILPPAWTEQPCAFRLRAVSIEGDFATVAVLRHAPRHDAEQAGLSGAIRILWAPEAEPPQIEARLARSDAGRKLAHLLQAHGDTVIAAVEGSLAARFGGTASHRSRLVALAACDDPRNSEILAGFPAAAAAAIAPTTAHLRGRWPALSPAGVEGWLTDNEFVPGAEAADHAV